MTPTIWIALGAVGAALVAALIARSVKISEFRQAWIDGLRADISEFISKSHEWIDLYLTFNAESNSEEKITLAPALDRIKYDAFHVLRRIELRFKPDDLEANSLLLALRDLLDPAKLSPDSQYPNWRRLADDTTLKARHLLKEEWEVTKNPFRNARKFGSRG
ncbi:hypothetical protein [Xanthomonas bonasiae]|uniref:hypothetical protein n=1 Tax=Xanthomonas bonasiae TaxID=2810351 RepID=UPI00177C1A1E|nr:hypothetical protein [Xanthomonas surreyensis]MBD7923738.1 hypothetical protein [Xanthomonas surreyensis]